jgi:hypothetical protein
MEDPDLIAILILSDIYGFAMYVFELKINEKRYLALIRVFAQGLTILSRESSLNPDEPDEPDEADENSCEYDIIYRI